MADNEERSRNSAAASGPTEPAATAANNQPTTMIDQSPMGVHGSESSETQTDDLLSQYSETKTAPSRRPGLHLNRIMPKGAGFTDVEYDVITVHGIRDDYNTAWKGRGGNSWVEWELFQRKEIRQFDYFYEIGEDSILYETDGIHLHAKSLLKRYSEICQECKVINSNPRHSNGREIPVIWLCHDLGGIIAKEALCIAMHTPLKYMAIAMRTTAIIFLGTPHKTLSAHHLEEQLYSLAYFPGSTRTDQTRKRVNRLTSQVLKSNAHFPATKLLDRATVFNVYSHDVQQDPEGSKHLVEEGSHKAVSPFPPGVHFLDHAFDSLGMIRCDDIDHVELVHRGATTALWVKTLSICLHEVSSQIESIVSPLRTRLLSLAPPSRLFETPLKPTLLDAPVIEWVHEQDTYKRFMQCNDGPRNLYLHGNGNTRLDIVTLSRQLCSSHDSAVRAPSDISTDRDKRHVLYFEFDGRDSRYRDLSSMIIYFLNALTVRYWWIMEEVREKLKFLNETRTWTLEDLCHLFIMAIDDRAHTFFPVLFISNIDQCPVDQWSWFLERMSHHYSYSEPYCRLILSASDLGGLGADSLPGIVFINLDECPMLRKATDITTWTEHIKADLNSLITARPVYESFEPLLSSLLEECQDSPHLKPVILDWLLRYHRGDPKSHVAQKIGSLSPVTARNVFDACLGSLQPHKQEWAKLVFNLVKHALEPWSPESLSELLAMQKFPSEEPSFDDIDPGDLALDINQTFCGLITVSDRDIKFSHASFYDLPEMGVEGSPGERAAKINSIIAQSCLRYFWLNGARKKLLALSPENAAAVAQSELLEAPIIMHQRTSMAEYAVRFWPRHFKDSGEFKPKKLVYELFSDKAARSAWETPHYALSNPFTRMQRSYISPMSTYAMLGLDDLVIEQSKREKGQPMFQRDRWYSIKEAARAGSIASVEWLLRQGPMSDTGLSEALLWAAACGERDVINALLERVQDLPRFQWRRSLMFPGSLMSRAATAGLSEILIAMARAGCDMNKPDSKSRKTPLELAIGWDQASVVEMILGFLDRTACNELRSAPSKVFSIAISLGNPSTVEAFLQIGAEFSPHDAINSAVLAGRHKALELLLNATDTSDVFEQQNGNPLVEASSASKQCVRILLDHGADPNLEPYKATALWEAVSSNRPETVRMLLGKGADPAYSNEGTSRFGLPRLLTNAVRMCGPEVASLLIDHGDEVNFVERSTFIGSSNATPLAFAATAGDIEMVKLLIAKGAQVNCKEPGIRISPLLAAVRFGHIEIARLLLKGNADVAWADSKGFNSLHEAIFLPELVPELLRSGVDIESRTNDMGTVLHYAAWNNCGKTLEKLLEHRPRPNLEAIMGHKTGGYPALLLAAHTRSATCFKILLEAGANPSYSLKDHYNLYNLEHFLFDWTDPEEAKEAFTLLTSNPNFRLDRVDRQGNGILHKIHKITPTVVIEVLIKAGAPVNQQNHLGHTPLSDAIRTGNTQAAKTLIAGGAKVEVYHSNFGSILHLACASGLRESVRLLLDAGARVDLVAHEYGESLLYTALRTGFLKPRERMIRYLVDDVKIPLQDRGGRFHYPIIFAAHLSRDNSHTHTKLLKFLIRRGADLEVADDQGRRAVHHAATTGWDDGLRVLVNAGASISPKDRCGRLPIHFAASRPDSSALEYLLSKNVDANIPDHDNWTPLLWAARSGCKENVIMLAEKNPDLWIQGRGIGPITWSALQLANFSCSDSPKLMLVPKNRTRVKPNGKIEKWDDRAHESEPGHVKEKYGACYGCLVPKILGSVWLCVKCLDVAFCFKCYANKDILHDPEHEFVDEGPTYKRWMHDDDEEDFSDTLEDFDIAEEEEEVDLDIEYP